MLFDYIRLDVLANKEIVRLSEMTELLVSYLMSLGVKQIKLSSRKHIRRNFQAEFSDDLLFDRNHQIPVVRYITALLLERQDNASQSSKGANIHQAAIDIREDR